VFYSSRFPVELSGLANALLGFNLHRIRKRIFDDKWHGCPLCQPK